MSGADIIIKLMKLSDKIKTLIDNGKWNDIHQWKQIFIPQPLFIDSAKILHPDRRVSNITKEFRMAILSNPAINDKGLQTDLLSTPQLSEYFNKKFDFILEIFYTYNNIPQIYICHLKYDSDKCENGLDFKPVFRFPPWDDDTPNNPTGVFWSSNDEILEVVLNNHHTKTITTDKSDIKLLKGLGSTIYYKNTIYHIPVETIGEWYIRRHSDTSITLSTKNVNTTLY